MPSWYLVDLTMLGHALKSKVDTKSMAGNRAYPGSTGLFSYENCNGAPARARNQFYPPPHSSM